jgi:hypothetical protein
MVSLNETYFRLQKTVYILSEVEVRERKGAKAQRALSFYFD